MKARVATFVQTNLGRKWREWLLTMDITDPEKKNRPRHDHCCALSFKRCRAVESEALGGLLVGYAASLLHASALFRCSLASNARTR